MLAEPTAGATQARLPDFLILGAAKAGTTALYGALSRHPQVHASPVKEPFFLGYVDSPPSFAGPDAEHFSRRVISDLASYAALFADCAPGTITGEATPEYLYSARAPAAAAEHIPRARLVAILRHPAERAHSQYLHMRHDGRETLDFEAALAAEDGRIASGWPPVWHYRARGHYGAQLDRWLNYFPREQLLILLYEDWLNRPGQTLASICHHLGIGPVDTSVVRRENVSSRQPRWAWLQHRMVEDNTLRRWASRRLPLVVRDAVTRTIRSVNLREGPTLHAALRARLASVYAADIDRVEALTGRDLSAWRM